MGGSKRAYAYSKRLKSDVVICYKQRKKANIISHMELIGNVEGKNVVLVDDMVDTAGTLTKAADLNDGKRSKISKSNLYSSTYFLEKHMRELKIQNLKN